MSQMEKMNPQHPLYLHGSDGPNSVTVDKLTGIGDYRRWQRSMEIALSSKRKLGFINGQVVKDEGDRVKGELWDTCNDTVIGWIMGSVTDSIKQTIMYMLTAKEIWEYLEKRYSVSNGSLKYKLNRDLYNHKQNNSSVNEYYTQMRGIWEELESLDHLPQIVTEGEDIIRFMEALEKQKEERKLFQFLNGIDESYSAQRSQLLMLIPLPSVETACSVIQQEESQRNVLNPGKTHLESSAMFSKENSGIETCNACGVRGHSKERCWTVVGYPKWHPKCKQKGREAPYGGTFNRNSGSQWSKGRNYPRTAAVVHGSSSRNSPEITMQQLESLLRNLPKMKQSGGSETEDEVDTSFSGFAGMVTCLNVGIENTDWIIDSGASDHMTSNINLCNNLTDVHHNLKINLPNGATSHITHYGDLKLNNDLTLKKVLIVPDFKHNLLSVNKLTASNVCQVDFYANYCTIVKTDDRRVIGIGECRNGLYYLVQNHDEKGKLNTSINTVSVGQGNITTDKPNAITTWHLRLGHAPIAKLKSLGFDSPSCKTIEHICTTCPMGKFTKQPFPTSLSQSLQPFELLHIDIWGPYRVQTRGKHRFFLTIVDDHTRTTWVTLLVHKSEAFSALKTFITLSFTQFNKKVKIVRSDNALEFDDWQCRELYDSLGIVHQTTCVDRAQQNGRAERKHRNVLEMARCLRFQAGLPKRYWGDCVLTAAYLINRLPSNVMKNKSPFEMLHHKKPTYDTLRVFGCLAFAYNPDTTGDKLEARGVPSVFLGYPTLQKGYRLLNLLTKKVFVSRDVKWYENVFPYQLSADQLAHLVPPTPDTHIHQPTDHTWQDSTDDESEYAADPTPTPTASPTASPSSPPCLPTSPPVRRSSRPHQTPSWLQDYVHPISNLAYANVNSEFTSFISKLSTYADPVFFRDACLNPNWIHAMNEEISALEENHTWTITELPCGKPAIGCKWLYKTKYLLDGSIERHKARLVILGNKQKYGVDYEHTFAPVAKLTTV